MGDDQSVIVVATEFEIRHLYRTILHDPSQFLNHVVFQTTEEHLLFSFQLPMKAMWVFTHDALIGLTVDHHLTATVGVTIHSSLNDLDFRS
ncbi:hypothetical protein D3C87_1955250 [compost metagenome]